MNRRAFGTSYATSNYNEPLHTRFPGQSQGEDISVLHQTRRLNVVWENSNHIRLATCVRCRMLTVLNETTEIYFNVNINIWYA